MMSGTRARATAALSLTVQERRAYIPSLSRRDRFRGQTTGPSARHTRHVDTQGRFARAATRLRDSATHPADFERSAGDSTRLPVPGTVPPGTPRLDYQ